MEFIFNNDNIIHSRNSDDGMIISNIRIKKHFKLNYTTFYMLNKFLDDTLTENEKLNDKNWTLEEKSITSQFFSLMADPSCINDNEIMNFNEKNSSIYAIEKKLETPLLHKGMDTVIKVLIDMRILIKNKKNYKNFFKVKENLFDTNHIGNFHQQIGYDLMVKYKVSPDKYWPSQKFRNNNILENMYKYVQLNFFNKYFDGLDLKDKKILDIGCGTGYYSRILLSKGASVVGIDPNQMYIDIAIDDCKKFGNKSKFIHGKIEENILDKEYIDSFDYIIISDMLLFYFVSPDPKTNSNPESFLSLVRNYLKDKGKLYITEPHGVFWLMPWLGDCTLPYTVVSEYSNKIQKVTPTLEEVAHAFKKSGYHIKDIYEPKPAEECKNDYSERAYYFATEFPLWWVFILGKEIE